MKSVVMLPTGLVHFWWRMEVVVISEANDKASFRTISSADTE
jgi:hypothetical protein